MKYSSTRQFYSVMYKYLFLNEIISVMFSEIILAHQSLAAKTKGLEYFQEWLKLISPYSWKIFHMRNIDQKEWRRIEMDVDQKMSRKESQLSEYLLIDKIMKENTKSLKKIVSKFGCITISRFGIVASHCAWLIVQHSDHDRKFQEDYLKMMGNNSVDVHAKDIDLLKRRIGK